MGKKTRWVVRPETEWEAIFEAEAGSHLSGAKFCRGQGIDYKQFLYHRNRIRKKEAGHLAVMVSAAAASNARRRGFIPINVAGSGSVRVCFPHGLMLESDGLPPAGWIVEAALRWKDAEISTC